MRKILLFAFLLPFFAYSQQYRNSVITDPQFGLINEIKPKPEVVGSVYLFDEWYSADLYLSTKNKVGDSNILEGVSIKYDISKHWLEIKTEQGVKVLPLSKISKIALVRNGLEYHYVNGTELSNSGELTNSLYEVLVDGDYKLLSRIGMEYIKSNYNAAMDVGEKNDRLVQKRTLYVSYGRDLTKVEKSKKKFLELFPEMKDRIEEFADKKKLGFKKEEHLIAIIEYCNLIYEKA